MHNITNKYFIFLFYFFPISFVIGSFAVNLTIFLLIFIFTFQVFLSKDFYIFKFKYFVICCTFTFYLGFITYLNNDLFHTFKALLFLRFLILPLIFYYFLKKNFLNKKKFLSFYLFILFILCFDLFFQKIFNFNFIGYEPSLWNEKLNIYERYAGFFGDELIAGGFIVNIGIICNIIYISVFDYSKKNVLVFVSFFIILIIGLFITGDRTPVIIFFSFILLSTIFIKKNRILFLPSLVVLIIFFLIGVNFSQNMKHRFIDYPLKRITQNENLFIGYEKIEDSNDSPAKNLLINNEWGRHYYLAYQMILDKPFFGYGIKSFRKYCGDYNHHLTLKFKNIENPKEIKVSKINACSTHPHNYVLEIILDSGILGLIMLIVIFYLAMNLAIKSTSNKLFVLAMIIFLVSLLSPFKPSGSFFSTWTSGMIWFILSLTYLFIEKK